MPDTGVKVNKFMSMKKKIKYKRATDAIAESIAEAKIIEDFLPPPHELVFKEDLERITLNLSKSSVMFFKKKAKDVGLPYQRMIKRVIDLYSKRYQQLHD